MLKVIKSIIILNNKYKTLIHINNNYKILFFNYNNIILNKYYSSNSNNSSSNNYNQNDSTDKSDNSNERKKYQLKQYIPRNFNEIDEKNKETFLQVIDTYKEITRQRTGHVEFIESALKYMKEFGVDKDLEIYKQLINVMPKGKLVPENLLQAEFMHYPKQQQCIIFLLEQMEDNGVIPDWETQDILINIFGERGYPVRKYYRMMYWMPKFRNVSPWLLPNPLPKDSYDLAKLAIERIMSVDPRSKITVYDAKNVPDAIDNTWIVSGISEAQKELIANQPKDKPIFVEGGFRIWLRNESIMYYILRTDPNLDDDKFIRPDPDDLRNLIDPFSIPDLFELKKKIITVHEQEDGIILAVAATGTSSQDSLLSWVRSLEKDGNPRLGEVPIMFTMQSPLGKTEGNEEIEDSGDNSERKIRSPFDELNEGDNNITAAEKNGDNKNR